MCYCSALYCIVCDAVHSRSTVVALLDYVYILLFIVRACERSVSGEKPATRSNLFSALLPLRDLPLCSRSMIFCHACSPLHPIFGSLRPALRYRISRTNGGQINLAVYCYNLNLQMFIDKKIIKHNKFRSM